MKLYHRKCGLRETNPDYGEVKNDIPTRLCLFSLENATSSLCILKNVDSLSQNVYNRQS